MKARLREWLHARGAYAFTRRSLPPGVDWVLDAKRSGLIGRQPLCLDVGANVGQTVGALRHHLRDARIHAFEPFAEPRRQLVQRWGGTPGVTLVPLAMGAAPAQLRVAPQAESVRNSLRDVGDRRAVAETIEVDTVDRYCAGAGIGEVTILKTDTEGWDLEVLRGAAALLAAQRVGFVYVEVTFLPDNTANTPFAPVFDWLDKHGYRMLGLYETYPLHHFAEPNVFCNALFVSSAWRTRARTRGRR